MRRVFLCTCLVVVCGALGATATENKGSLESPHQLDDSTVVTANRYGLSFEQAIWPATIISLDRELAQPSLATVLEGQAGVDIRSYNGDGSVATLSSWGVFNRHMLLLYNGRVVKDYSLGGFNLSDFSADEFERVEIVKGPQSAFYGSDAVGGVVNLISRNAMVQRTDFVGRIGSFGYRQYRADMAHKIGPLGIGVGMEQVTTDNRRANGGVDRLLGSVRGDYVSGDNCHALAFTARYFNDSLGVPGPVPDQDFIPAYGNNESNSLTARQQDENYSFDLQYRYDDDESTRGQVDLFWEKKELEYRSLYNYSFFYEGEDESFNVDSVDVLAYSRYLKRSSGLSVRLIRDTGPMVLAGGVDWLSGSLHASSDDTSHATNIVGPFAPYEYGYVTAADWDGRQNQFDVWSNVASTEWNRMHIDVSGRLQFVSGRKTQPSYNLGLNYHATHSVRVKLGYAYAFRLPSIAEQFADDVYTAGNSGLDPETARSLHGSVAVSALGDRLSCMTTVFHQRIASLILYEYNPTIFRSAPVNVERFRSTGIDINLEADLGSGISLSWDGVVQEAEQTTDHGQTFVKAYYVPDIKWRADLAVHSALWDGSVTVSHTSERSIEMWGGSEKEISSVYELGLGVGVHLSRVFHFGLSVHDLTDQRRPDQFGFTTGDGDYPGLGRRFLLEVKISPR
ncbi:MAG: TonB-dependent receptor [candidate division Zixibacteria bacterium]|nr:TonB-dependent receptor [candidate division Zixibacteria bacterium]